MCMIFYSTQLSDLQTIENLKEFSPGAIPASFHSVKLIPRNIYPGFFLIKSFHPSLLSRKPQTLLFSWSPRKNPASKDFQLHPHKNSGIIKVNFGLSPIRMIFFQQKKYVLAIANETGTEIHQKSDNYRFYEIFVDFWERLEVLITYKWNGILPTLRLRGNARLLLTID